jgi:hypothetical protein
MFAEQDGQFNRAIDLYENIWGDPENLATTQALGDIIYGRKCG